MDAVLIKQAANITSHLITDHDYYPLKVEIPNYLVNEWSVPTLLSIFFAGWAVILGGTHYYIKTSHNHLSVFEKATIWWLVLSGSIHLFFEGYFSVNHYQMGSAQDLFGQLWKEYALGDSRYLTSDPFVLCMETVTAFTWGPLCFICAYMVTTNHGLRHPLQMIVCVGQVYGLILYYATSMFDHYYKGIVYSRPEFLYFWFYYFFMNFIWMVFPNILLVHSVSTIGKAMTAMNKLQNPSNGKAQSGKKNL